MHKILRLDDLGNGETWKKKKISRENFEISGGQITAWCGIMT
jgi:hypothetical protein